MEWKKQSGKTERNKLTAGDGIVTIGNTLEVTHADLFREWAKMQI